MNRLKSHFFTGLVILLPIAVTYMLLMFFINLLTRPFLKIVKDKLQGTRFIQEYFYFLNYNEALLLISKFLIFITIIFVVLIVGFIGRNVLVRPLIHAFDKLMRQIPLINKVYHAAHEVVTTLLHSERQSFSKVVLVPFPNKKTRCIGFLVSEKLPEGSDEEMNCYISVFIPSTPNPTIGFMLLVDRNDVQVIDMTIETGLKFVVSCGMMSDKPEAAVL